LHLLPGPVKPGRQPQAHVQAAGRPSAHFSQGEAGVTVVLGPEGAECPIAE